MNRVRNDLPPITIFLNQLLTPTIDLPNVLVTAFEQLLNARRTSETCDVGLVALRAERFVVAGRSTIYTRPSTGQKRSFSNYRPSA